jgi:hypothetical protein
MYFRANNVRVTKGDNLLSVVLKHKFSQITTIVDASDVASGNGIKVIDTPVISNQRATGNSIKLSDGVVTYGATGVLSHWILPGILLQILYGQVSFTNC